MACLSNLTRRGTRWIMAGSLLLSLAASTGCRRGEFRGKRCLSCAPPASASIPANRGMTVGVSFGDEPDMSEWVPSTGGPATGDAALAAYIAAGVTDPGADFNGTRWGDGVRAEPGETYLTALGVSGRYALLRLPGGKSVQVAVVREADGRWTLIPDVLTPF